MQGSLRKLSEKQRNMLGFINSYLSEHGYPPSVRDIQRGCAISSTSVVDYNLQILHRDGHIRRSSDISRGIEVLSQDKQATSYRKTISVPVIGYIAAGEPLPTFTDSFNTKPMENLDVPTSMIRAHEGVFALRVRGLSMIDALVGDGDIIVLEHAKEVRTGEMAAVWLKEERKATLKHVYKEGGQVRLQPANTHMEPIITTAQNVEVQGRVAGVIRFLG